jgi:hypothetical protein
MILASFIRPHLSHPHMRFAVGRLAVVGLLLIASACSASRSSSRARSDRSVITHAQLAEHHFNNLFEAVQSLRANWLQTRGPDSFQKPTVVWVYLDESRLGGVETLRTIPPTNVVSVRFIDGIQASARWGLDHGQGVIQVATR